MIARTALLSSFAVFLTATAALPRSADADVSVVASIKPIHALVAAVMDGAGEPDLLMDGASSPHTYALKPSQARALESADLVFWVGRNLEAFLVKPLENIAGEATVVELFEAPGLNHVALREGGAFEGHDHDHGHDEEGAHQDGEAHDHDSDEHGHQEGDGHAHEAGDEHHEGEGSEHADEHGGEEHAHAEGSEDHAHAHDGEEQHPEGGRDAHIWLDPLNAIAMANEIAHVLADADPSNAETYDRNAANLAARLTELTGEIGETLAPVADGRFIVFHDAYLHFEGRFGLSAAGSLTVSPEVMPGAERLSEIRQRLLESEASCVFAEPQFEPRLITAVAEGTSARTGVLDPLGANLEEGPDLYMTLIRNMAASFQTCLSPNG